MKSIRSLLLLLPAIGFFVWSYILTDRSLTLTQFHPYLLFQNFLWRFADNHVLQTYLFLILIFALFLGYFVLLRSCKKAGAVKISPWIMVAGLLLFALSMNALSYDLYNYMFDAKLVVHYHFDPHVTSAISFTGKDSWVEFMRNTFFPTTYGYAWTALSVVPYIAGFGKLVTVFVAFKLYALFAFLLLFLTHKALMKKLQIVSGEIQWRLALFFASPLVLIESLSSAHNDVWMMLPAFASLLVLISRKSRTVAAELFNLILSAALLFTSVQIKRATLLLIPVWLYFVFRRLSGMRINLLEKYWGDAGAILMFLPLFTGLSRQFNPWYLIWPLSFLPFVKSKLLRVLLLVFSVTSLLRYVPILYTGMYSIPLETIQRTITWSAVPIGLLIYYALWLMQQKKRIK